MYNRCTQSASKLKYIQIRNQILKCIGYRLDLFDHNMFIMNMPFKYKFIWMPSCCITKFFFGFWKYILSFNICKLPVSIKKYCSYNFIKYFKYLWHLAIYKLKNKCYLIWLKENCETYFNAMRIWSATAISNDILLRSHANGHNQFPSGYICLYMWNY